MASYGSAFIICFTFGSILHTILAQRKMEHFKTELFLSDDDLNAGLYEGMVTGRRLFGSSQVPHGHGTIHYFTNDKYNRDNYTGSWMDGNRQGNGTTYFRDGSSYSGEYADSLENGVGVITYANGDVLDGNFVDGIIEGHAVLRYTNGDQREGFYAMNKLDGQVIYTRSNGRTVVEIWDMGERLRDEAEVISVSAELDQDESLLPPSPPLPSLSPSPAPKATFSLKVLRGADRSQAFDSNPEPAMPPRTPRIQVTQDDALAEMPADRIMSLRAQTERRNKDFLRTVFDQVNSKRRKRRRNK